MSVFRKDVWAVRQNGKLCDVCQSFFFAGEVCGQAVCGWTCPACGKTYPAGTGCADCGLTARSDAMDIETARKRRELSAQDFEAWQESQRREREEAAKKLREEILGGIFDDGRGSESIRPRRQILVAPGADA